MNKWIDKINLNKVAIAYLITGLIVAICLILVVGNKFKSKIEFIYNYHTIREMFEERNYNMDTIKEKIKSMSNSSEDIVDILILNKDNKIIYSSKESEFGKQEEFLLSRVNNIENKYFENFENSNIIFELVRDKELMLSTILSNIDLKIEKNYEDNVFFESEFNNKNIYSLSYAASKKTGEKIYFINEIQPVQNGEMYIKMSLAIIMFFFMLYWVLVALSIYQNARKSKLNPYIWGGITLLTNIAGVIVYLIYKQNNKTCIKCGAVQNKYNSYCINCGSKLNETCSKCGTVIKSRDNFCGKCGEKH